ncbi:MAG: hypothetical protein A4E23_00645 [Methanomethylovorans sp. PtaU1.Bin073]|jgi:hypothetical protein|nr:MAG: hypothetical protein A4E23_00645 [Methanomethylovorans sp. PtaU1.Bin073]
MFDIIAVDISGRHIENGEYFMVCAAVSFSVSPDHIDKTHQVNIRHFTSSSAPELTDVVEMVEKTVEGLNPQATIVMEAGDMFNRPQWLVTGMFSRDFKYQESLSERRAIELAHHISVSARRLLKNRDSISVQSNTEDYSK